jgi:hypothetical protein
MTTVWLDVVRVFLVAGTILLLTGSLRLLWVTRGSDADEIAHAWRPLTLSYMAFVVACIALQADDFGTSENIAAMHVGAFAVGTGLYGLNRVLPLAWPPWLARLRVRTR